MLTAAERHHLRRHAWRQGFSSFALLVLPVLAGVLLWRRESWFPHIAMELAVALAVLAVFWMVLMRRSPGQWRRIRADLRSGDVTELQGPSGLATRRGFGLFAPTHLDLVLRGRCFDARDFDATALLPGEVVRVRHAATSGVLLAVAPEVGAGDATSAAPAAARTPVALNEREQALLERIARGLSDKLIARELGLSPGTVRTYNSTLFRKLGVENRREAVRWAQDHASSDVD